MTKRIEYFDVGDTIPPGAKYLYSAHVPDRSRRRERWETDWSILGLWTKETCYEIIPNKVVHYYEVDVDENS